ncbi:hypothetical protein [Zhongshania sp.]|uniref:hypothetical protein n=1 Tax=Zhongshania sp. TaxID=1971902 RepID=UPI0035619567
MSSVLRCKLRIKARGIKQAGYVITTELVLLTATILVGTIIGWIAIRDALLQEMFDFASAIEANTYFAFDGLSAGQQPRAFENSSTTNFSGRSAYIANSNGEGGIVLINGDNDTTITDPVSPPIDPPINPPDDPPIDPVTPTDPGPNAPVYSEIPFLDVVDPDPLALVVITEKVSILDCISRATRYNINIVKALGGDLTGQCEVLLNEVPDPSTIPADIENIAFLLLIDPVTGLATDRVSIADCMARLTTASAGQIYIEDLAADGIGSCTILL